MIPISPILFTSPMVRAILAGHKTQTRRIVKPQPPNEDYTVCDYCDWEEDSDSSGIKSVKFSQPFDTSDKWGWWPQGYKTIKSPYGQPGDRLWVRETFMPMPHLNARAFYRASDPLVGGKWKPSIFMPRSLSRITLEITGIRVERLTSITEAHALAEGVAVFEDGAGYTIPRKNGKPGAWQRNPEDAYRALWESINGSGSWDRNPWVWVITFRPIPLPFGI